MGLASVASDFPGTRVVVVPEETGLLVPPGKPGPLADALQRLLADAEWRRRMGAAARARIEQRFSSRNHDRVLEIIRHVAEGP